MFFDHLLTSILLIKVLLNPEYAGIFLFFKSIEFQVLTVEGARDGSMSYVVGLPNNSYKPIINTTWVRAQLCKLQKGCTQPAAASDKVYQLFAHGRWFSPRTPASSTTKTSRHDIAEILLKVALNTINQIKSTIEGYNRLEKIIRS
jgi:hypothetical protein